jgi:hypothetical protein
MDHDPDDDRIVQLLRDATERAEREAGPIELPPFDPDRVPNMTSCDWWPHRQDGRCPRRSRR